MALSKASVHIDKALTNMTVRYANSRMDLVGSKVLPFLPVPKSSDKYFIFTQSNAFNLPENLRVGPTSQAVEIEWDLSTGTYTCDGYANKQAIPQELVADADAPLDLRFSTIENGIDIALLAYEKRVADLVFDAANYASSNKATLSGSNQFSDSTSDVIGLVQTAVEGCFFKANKIVMGLDTYKAIRKHPQIMDALPSNISNTAENVRKELAGIFDVEEVIIGRAKYNTAKKGQTASYSQVWGDYLLAYHQKANISLNTATFGFTLAWDAVGGAAGYLVRRWTDESIGTLGGEWIQVNQKVDEKIVAADLGYLYSDCVA